MSNMNLVRTETPAHPVSNGAMPVASATAITLATQVRAQIEARYIVARGAPRSDAQVRERLITICTKPSIAKTLRYSKPTGDGAVTGWSVRFAEEAMRAFGNLDVIEAVVDDTEHARTVRVSVVDLERNIGRSADVYVEKTVERSSPSGRTVLASRRNTKGNTTYTLPATEDEVMVKVGAQVAKARRNLIVSMIPDDILDECAVNQLHTVKDADAKDPAAEGLRIADLFYLQGIDVARLEAMLGHPIERVTPAEINLLRGIYRAVKDGDAAFVDLEEQYVALRDQQAKKTSGAAPAAPAPAKAPESRDVEAQEAPRRRRSRKPEPEPEPVSGESDATDEREHEPAPAAPAEKPRILSADEHAARMRAAAGTRSKSAQSIADELFP